MNIEQILADKLGLADHNLITQTVCNLMAENKHMKRVHQGLSDQIREFDDILEDKSNKLNYAEGVLKEMTKGKFKYP